MSGNVDVAATPLLLASGTVDTLADHRAAGGVAGLQAARSMSGGEVVAAVEQSGLRGRGGAGFPTGVKWRSVLEAVDTTAYVVCNAAEGEPGTFKDRWLLRHNPYLVVEGLLIAADTVDAGVAFVALKERFGRERAAVDRAVEEMDRAGLLADVTVEVVAGPDEYLYGEEKAMLEVIEGRAPLPRVLPPYQVGLFATRGGRNPTVVNNVETLANVPGILREGPGWLRARGTEDSPGTMLFTLCGDVRRPGVYELPLGTPLGTLIEEVGGGTPRDRQLRAMLPGASAAVLTPEDLSVPLDFDALREAGSALGSGGFAVYDDSACMVSVAATFSRFLYAESCGQCPACKKGSREITGWLERVARGTGDPDDLERARSRCDSVTGGQRCGLPSGEAAVVRSLLDTFGDEFERHLGRSCTQRRQRPLPLLEDFDEAARRFVYTGRHVYRVDRGSAGSDATTSEERADAGWIDVG